MRVAALLIAAVFAGALGGSLVLATMPALAPEAATTIPKSNRLIAPAARVVSECRSA